ncbi:MAG: heparan-alpha-glucosaminide N-acetyltransferase domain-containing protein [Nitrosomonas sp.]|nr:MAG: heparan-alpha-glucosaminide N-acetyltransferase domain-containing protein [Nitrosomonas sp.]
MPIDKNAQRIAAIDWLRGIVMILMALDHTSWFFNSGRIFADSVLLHEAGTVFAADQFLTRWITHICAPTFIFLAGTSIAISAAQRRQSGLFDTDIDREVLLRGALIALLDLTIFSWVAGKPILQVLYAIGISMMLMVYLQRLGTQTVLWLSLLIIAGSELLLTALWHPGDATSFWLALTFAPVFSEAYTVLYPAIPWLGIMMLGWAFGMWLLTEHLHPQSPDRLLMTIGWFALTLFVVVRGIDGYGNMYMYLEGNTLLHWLHVSKYPPSLAYALLELGIMAIVLALLMRLEARKKDTAPNGPVLVFGQTALFFYLAHFAVLTGLKPLFDSGGLQQTYWISLLVLIILYPVCRGYRNLKRRHPQSLLRFL